MAKKFWAKSKHFYRWSIVIILIIITMIIGSMAFFAKRVSPFLSQKLKNRVIHASDSLYHIEFSKLEVNLWTGSILMTGFRLIPDTLVYNRLKMLKRAPENIFNLSVPEMQLRHAHPLMIALRKEVKVKDIRFDYPEVEIIHQDLFQGDTTQSIERILANLVSGSLHAIRVDRMDLNNITIFYKNKSDPTAKGFSLGRADLTLKDFYIDTSSVKDTTRLFYAKDLGLHLVNLKMPTVDSLYWLEFKDVIYSVRQQKATVKGLSLKPRYSKTVFDKKVGHQQDRFDLKVDSITVLGLDLLTIIRKKKIGLIQKLDLSHADIDIYHNRSLPPKSDVKPLPQEMLSKAAKNYISKGVAVIFTLDTLSIQHFNITYSELNPKTRRIGTVTFQEIGGSFHHMTNDSAMLATNNHCAGDFRTLFMGREKASAHFDFNLTDSSKPFSFSGSLGYMDATMLNKATRNLGLVDIKSGEIHRVHFKFSGDRYRSTGSVTLLYDDLSVKLLSKDNITGKLKKKGLASLFANLVVLKNNNTANTSAIKTTNIVYQRDPKKSILNMMWKSLFEGVKKIIGMS